MTQRIRIPKRLANKLSNEARWLFKEWRNGAWVDCESPERNSTLWTGFPAFFMPWNRNRRPIARKR